MVGSTSRLSPESPANPTWMQHCCKAQEWESEVMTTSTAQREGKVLKRQFFSNRWSSYRIKAGRLNVNALFSKPHLCGSIMSFVLSRHLTLPFNLKQTLRVFLLYQSSFYKGTCDFCDPHRFLLTTLILAFSKKLTQPWESVNLFSIWKCKLIFVRPL